ncbi:hypothetical protein FNV43_RR21121 [Rhamnella rubrinervis]|uniref:Disease resistance R13L4/SHOC-2-like LRR domain-containing protein n=1 Tax=Rhamnella rubrinervis TaxID=2594499 RepID=A0A8K0E236_9ROSA|nr:hypothetical protein FNV43_RR21121 [Rhamnella rubrinervis]
MKYWNTEGGIGDCCLWDGVSCDTASGYVIAIDLSSSWLYGPLTSNSSLFRLLHLQKLNLAFNDFASCTIPSEFGQLSRLTYLNLSYSMFDGHIPYEISRLTNLMVLDLSGVTDNLYVREVKLGRLITQNMTNLRQLYLDRTNLFSPVPEFFGNLSSLTHLSLPTCHLLGKLPRNIFQLPNLQYIDLNNNSLTGYLPEFNVSSRIKYLFLAQNSFYGKLPDSIGNLKSLNFLDVRKSNFSGIVPPSLGNLSQLSKLDLSDNCFYGQLPYTIGNLAKLTVISLSENHFSGGLPSSLGKLAQLEELNLGYNNFSGQVPTSLLGNLTRLQNLLLDNNYLSGQIPSSFGNLTQLVASHLYNNRFSGPIPSSLGKLTQLKSLLLSSNLLDGELPISFPHSIESIELMENRLTGSIPSTSIANVTLLQELDLSSNSFTGVIPSSLFGLRSLIYLRLDCNRFTGSLNISNFSNLGYLSAIGNNLNGPLLVPPMSTWFYSVSGNRLTGSFDPLFCTLIHLQYLDLSSNNLSGTFPECFGSWASSLTVLNLRSNNFNGKMPRACGNGSHLTTLDLSHNQLHGKIPKSLTECKGLGILNLGHNQMSDSFPFWLQNLSRLQILVLSHNKFYGSIWRPHNFWGFPYLKIIDLSFNDFTGSLSAQYFLNWTSMAGEKSDYIGGFSSGGGNYYSMTVIYKGQEMGFIRVLSILVSIDLSNNRFHGEIPTTIGALGALVVLNLSSNGFTGYIPSSMSNLTELESLDVSDNKLSGEIPRQLNSLTFLGYLNMSENEFVGPIPQGGQIANFPDSSFLGNLGLCGRPLSKMCETALSPTPSPNINVTSGDDSIMSGFTRKVVAIGYGCGVVFGVVGGHVIISRRPYLMWIIFRVIPQRRRRR